jgi:MFS family permease
MRARAQARPRLAASVGLWAATVCGFLAIGAVLPVLPRYVRGPIGAGDLAVGVVVGCFAFAAVIGRPVGGRLADAHGRRVILVAGLLVSSLAGTMYLLPLGVPGLIAARLVLGVGDGWVFTAGATWIVDLAPEERRGQAIGLFGLAIWGGLTAGPIIGELLLQALSYDAVWAFAAAAPLLGVAIALRLPEDHTPPPPLAPGTPRAPLLPPSVVAPGVALALANAGYGTMAAFVVLHLQDRGVGGGATVFTAFAGSIVASRLVAGSLPDRLGPTVTATAAALAESAGLALIAVATSFGAALAGAIVMGVGFSLLFPSLAVIAMARVAGVRRGAALGVFTAFFDAGVGLGAPLAGVIAATAGYQAAFLMAAGAALLSALVAGGLHGGRARRPRAVARRPSV